MLYGLASVTYRSKSLLEQILFRVALLDHLSLSRYTVCPCYPPSSTVGDKAAMEWRDAA